MKLLLDNKRLFKAAKLGLLELIKTDHPSHIMHYGFSRHSFIYDEKEVHCIEIDYGWGMGHSFFNLDIPKELIIKMRDADLLTHRDHEWTKRLVS